MQVESLAAKKTGKSARVTAPNLQIHAIITDYNTFIFRVDPLSALGR